MLFVIPTVPNVTVVRVLLPGVKFTVPPTDTRAGTDTVVRPVPADAAMEKAFPTVAREGAEIAVIGPVPTFGWKFVPTCSSTGILIVTSEADPAWLIPNCAPHVTSAGNEIVVSSSDVAVDMFPPTSESEGSVMLVSAFKFDGAKALMIVVSEGNEKVVSNAIVFGEKFPRTVVRAGADKVVRAAIAAGAKVPPVVLRFVMSIAVRAGSELGVYEPPTFARTGVFRDVRPSIEFGLNEATVVTRSLNVMPVNPERNAPVLRVSE